MKLQISTAALVIAAVTASVALANGDDPAYRPQVDPSVQFPSPGGAWIPRGTFVSPAALRQVTPGLTKPQIYPLLGPPHFSNPWPFVRTWNYIFDFHTGEGDAFVQCQYQIRFAGEPPVVKATYWKDASCARFLDAPAPVAATPPPPPPLAPAPPPPPAPKEAKSYTVYFAFDDAGLTPDAKAVIADAASYEKDGGAGSVVIGYTDTSGSAAYNEALSERRAKAVADELVAQGVAADALDVSWRGKTDLAVPTPDGVKEPLNRRTTIKVEPKN
ncbi:MAG: OmpA family protein [Caulobacteraceae bacterium]